MSDWQRQVFPEPFFRPPPERVPAPPITALSLLSRSFSVFIEHAPFLFGVSLVILVLTMAGTCACYVPGMIVGTLSGWSLAAWSLSTIDGRAELRAGRVAITRPLHATLGAVWFSVLQAAPAAALAVPVLAGLLAAIPFWQAPALAVPIYVASWGLGLAASGVVLSRVGAARFLAVEHDVNPVAATADVTKATAEAWVPLGVAYAIVMVSVLAGLPLGGGLYGVVSQLPDGSTAHLAAVAGSMVVLTVFGMLWYGVLSTLDAVTYRALGYPVARDDQASG